MVTERRRPATLVQTTLIEAAGPPRPAVSHCRPHACCGVGTLLGLPRKLSRHHMETDGRECSDHLTPTQQDQAITMQVHAILKTSMLGPPGGNGVKSTNNTIITYCPNLTAPGKGSRKNACSLNN